MTEIHIIDHDSDHIRYLTQLLHHQGYRISDYSSAEMFLEQELPDSQVPGCLLIELHLPRLNGAVLYERFLATHLELPVIFFSSQTEPATIVQLIKQGAFDFLRKPLEAEHLLERIRQATNSHALKLHARSNCYKWQEQLATLTARERQVLQMTLQALNTKEISHRLNICVKTVSRHRMNLLEKLKCKNEIDMISKMLKFQLVGLAPETSLLELKISEANLV